MILMKMNMEQQQPGEPMDVDDECYQDTSGFPQSEEMHTHL